MLGEIALHQLRERQRARDAALPAKALELALERLARVLLGGEPASLDSLRASAADAEAVRPEPFTVASAGCELEHLSFLEHSGITPSFQESTPSTAEILNAGVRCRWGAQAGLLTIPLELLRATLV